MTFDEMFADLKVNEGGFSNDADDPGNWTSGVCGKGELNGTMMGISAASYPNLDIRNLKEAEVREIYQRDFWEVWRFDGLSAPLPDTLLAKLFDAGVNTGMGNAKRFLQRAVGVADDGRIGPVTIQALDKALQEHGVGRVEMWLTGYKLRHYASLTKLWVKYGRGWSLRVVRDLLAL